MKSATLIVDENTFVQTVMDRLHCHRENLGFPKEMEDWEEKEFKEIHLPRLFKEGWTMEDAYQFHKLTEHVNPNLSEDYACKRMKKISDKYKRKE